MTDRRMVKTLPRIQGAGGPSPVPFIAWTELGLVCVNSPAYPSPNVPTAAVEARGWLEFPSATKTLQIEVRYFDAQDVDHGTGMIVSFPPGVHVAKTLGNFPIPPMSGVYLAIIGPSFVTDIYNLRSFVVELA